VRPAAEDYSVRLEFLRDGHPVRSDNHWLAGGRHPLPEWQASDVVRETRLVYLGAEAEATEVRIGLVRWGAGPDEARTVTLSLQP
jgi:hypothetical protein